MCINEKKFVMPRPPPNYMKNYFSKKKKKIITIDYQWLISIIKIPMKEKDIYIYISNDNSITKECQKSY